MKSYIVFTLVSGEKVKNVLESLVLFRKQQTKREVVKLIIGQISSSKHKAVSKNACQ